MSENSFIDPVDNKVPDWPTGLCESTEAVTEQLQKQSIYFRAVLAPNSAIEKKSQGVSPLQTVCYRWRYLLILIIIYLLILIINMLSFSHNAQYCVRAAVPLIELVSANSTCRKSYDLPQVANLFKQLSEDPAALQAALSSSNRTTPVANSEESNGRRISAPLAPISQPSNLGRSLIASRSVFGEPIHAPSTSRNSYAFSAKKRSNNTKGQYPDFSKKVILLEKWRNKPLTVTEEKELRKSGCVCDSMTFQKKMNESEILKKIETYFNDKKGKLVKSDNLQILQSLGNELFEYEIEEDQLTGELLSKNNKPMYVRVRSPKEEDIITKNSDSEEDVFQTKRPRPSTSCNKKADNPKESPKESESTPGVYFFTDEFGTEHRLVDHIPVKYDSTDHSNSTVCPQEIKSVIDMCQVKVSKTQTILVPVNRQNVTEMFLSVLSKNPDLPFRTLTVDFSNENGVGVGPRKELFSLLLLNIRESKLLEGKVLNIIIPNKFTILDRLAMDRTFESRYKYGEY